MPASIEALLGFSQRDDEPVSPREVAVPGYPDDRIPASFAHVDYYPEMALQSARYVDHGLPELPAAHQFRGAFLCLFRLIVLPDGWGEKARRR